VVAISGSMGCAGVAGGGGCYFHAPESGPGGFTCALEDLSSMFVVDEELLLVEVGGAVRVTDLA